MKVLLVTFYFPPAGGAGVQRPLKFASELARAGVKVHVLAPDDPRWLHRDEDLAVPAKVRCTVRAMSVRAVGGRQKSFTACEEHADSRGDWRSRRVACLCPTRMSRG
jgi:hypothetical protein